ncbi:hypothetical protein [Emticicia sp. C21]|uniref:hypothetical protein n=1 Tax=Emticicia sp. C21 TaxID=2302915 RepID=UPI000E341B81|nr:hypothetical protein [Emticicia sp. C21]RFS16290.1 hypothetical protein D0T08_11420 [Emticicia sp. C21]
MQSKSSVLDKKFWAICLVLGQFIVIISSFLWKENGRHSVNGSVLVFFSTLFLAIGMVGLFYVLKPKMPIYSRLGFLYGMYGIFGGVGFAFEGLYSSALNISDTIGLEAFKSFPTQMNLVLYWSGPAFPLTFLILGIVYIRVKVVKWWVGVMLSLGGITFPISRILRNEWIAHLNDVILFIPLCIIAYQFWNDAE